MSADKTPVERVARAMLNDISNGTELNLADQYARIISIQLSSADFMGMAQAAISALIPAGWKLVPVEATEEMLENAAHSEDYNECRAIWDAMIAAAPGPPEGK